jgi:serine/threonine protein kinase
MFSFDILSAISEIHKQDIIHCDIKPQNFLLFDAGIEPNNSENNFSECTESLNMSIDSYDPNIILKVTDFGLAHIIPKGQGKAFMKFRAGTMEYKAPEVKDVRIK